MTGAWQTYTANVTLTGQDHMELVFANDASDATTDRNLASSSASSADWQKAADRRSADNDPRFSVNPRCCNNVTGTPA